MYFGIYQSKYTHLLLFDRRLLKSTGRLQDHQLHMQPHFPKIIIQWYKLVLYYNMILWLQQFNLQKCNKILIIKITKII